MKKTIKIAFTMFVCIVLTFVFAGVYATETSVESSGEETVNIKEVSNEDELLAALADSSVQLIRLTKDITTTAKVNIIRDVIIEGESHTITLDVEDNKVWGGHYVLQAYKCDVMLNNINLTGGNAGLLINGGNVTVEGILDVSGNGFGGIELAEKDGIIPNLDLINATLKNTTEAYLLPTIWEDPFIEDTVVTEGEDYLYSINVNAANGNEQVQYYLDMTNAVDTPDNQVKEQIAAGESEIVIVVNEENAVISKDVLNDLKAGSEKDVLIYSSLNGYEYGITFNTKNITSEFEKDLDLNIEVTETQPFKSDVLKDVKTDMVFIDLDYSGTLPKETQVIFEVGQFGYKEGDKFMVYYYNPTSDNMELISKEVVVDEFGRATIKIDHASTYVLSTGELPVKSVSTNNTPPSNPNTSDMTMFVALTLAVIAVAGFGYVAKVKMSTNKK